MNRLRHRHGRFAVGLLIPMFASAAMMSVMAQQPLASKGGAGVEQDEPTLRFAFDRAPWRDVIQWIAEEAGLALHVGDLPPGSFTYSDPGRFTHQQAIDRINLFLLPQGFTLVRSAGLLSVIDLGDPRSMQQLDVLSQIVTVEELDERNSHDVVKCIFRLGDIDAEEAVQELSVLDLMTTPKILSRTNQLMITDTAGKLRNARSILQAFDPQGMQNGTVVKSFNLRHVEAEDVLVVARPHLGLATGEMIGIDVSVSADVLGKHIFVTGIEDKVALLEGLVEVIDQPDRRLSGDIGEAILQSHLIEGGNVETVFNVLQTLLAGKSIRLSMDEDSDSIVALASADIQEEITRTVVELQASEADFEVIPLNAVDPFFAVTLIEQMLDLPDPLDDPDDIDPDLPKIDADPASMRLFVRAKRPQIEQIKRIVEGLDVRTDMTDEDTIRVLPFKGQEATRVLQTAAKFWKGDNPIVLYPSFDSDPAEGNERVVAETADGRLTAAPIGVRDVGDEQWLAGSRSDPADLIRCQLTPRGLLIQCDDTVALVRFEQQIRTIAGPADATPSPPIVFYLKYTKADDALRMLADLLDGGESASFAESGSLVNGYISNSDSFLGSFVTSRDGMMTLTTGSMTVVADSRLNRLIAQGTTGEIETLEEYLQIVDKDNSLTSIETYGVSRVIELVNTKANEVAATIREAYAGRVAATPSPQAAGTKEKGEKPQSDEKERGEKDAKAANSKKTNAQPPRDLEPKMTVAVHEPSNSLIVTAPAQLFEEVEQLAMSIDQRAQQTVEVITPVNGAAVESMLYQVLLGETPPRRPNSTPRTGASRAPEVRRDRFDK